MMSRPGALLRLSWRFFMHCVISGLSTARIILQPKQTGDGATAERDRCGGIVRMPFAPMSETGAALLGAMVSLTPGSSAIDIDLERREMVLHLLDIDAAQASVAAIANDFGRDIAILFPAREVS